MHSSKRKISKLRKQIPTNKNDLLKIVFSMLSFSLLEVQLEKVGVFFQGWYSMKLSLAVGTVVNIPLFFLFGSQGIISKMFFTQLFQKEKEEQVRYF